MAPRSGSSQSSKSAFSRKVGARDGSLPVMSETQIQAYLTARETLRRIRQAASHAMSPRGDATLCRSQWGPNA